MSFTPRPYEIYKHFKGNLYQVIAVAQHTETDEQLVIYQALYGDYKFYARPLAMFTDPVDREKYPDVKQKYRFELQEEQPQPEELPRQEADISRQTGQTAPETAGENCDLDPFLLEFLDADSYEQRLNILAGLHHRITDDMLTTMAVACDLELEDGSIEEKYASLRSCLMMLEKYECNRLR